MVGLRTAIHHKMTTSNKNNNRNAKIKQIIELLKFALSVDDEEIIQSSIESVIEMLEEEID